MIEILCTRSARGRSSATMACPASWCATISFSRGLISRDRRSSPPTTRSMASSKSAMLDDSVDLIARRHPGCGKRVDDPTRVLRLLTQPPATAKTDTTLPSVALSSSRNRTSVDDVTTETRQGTQQRKEERDRKSVGEG